MQLKYYATEVTFGFYTGLPHTVTPLFAVYAAQNVSLLSHTCTHTHTTHIHTHTHTCRRQSSQCLADIARLENDPKFLDCQEIAEEFEDSETLSDSTVSRFCDQDCGKYILYWYNKISTDCDYVYEVSHKHTRLGMSACALVILPVHMILSRALHVLRGYIVKCLGRCSQNWDDIKVPWKCAYI